MKKWIGVCLLGLALAPAALGEALITKGSNELAVDGKLDFATEVGTDFKLGLKYAYFVIDRLSVGMKGSMGNNDAVDSYGIGVTAEYNFVLPEGYRPLVGTDLVPYVGIGVDYRYTKLFDKKESAAVLSGETGVKFFLTDSTAVSLALVGEWASEDIYADKLDAENTDFSLRLGMRFYF